MTCGCSKPKPGCTTTTPTVAMCSTGGTSTCAAKLPFMTPWSKGCTPYPKGSIVIHGNCLWAQTAPMGEYAPPGAGNSGWKPYDQATLVALLTDPATFLLPYIVAALKNPDITSGIQLETCNV